MQAPDSVKTVEEYIAHLEEPRRSVIAELDRIIREAAPTLEPGITAGMIGYGPYEYRTKSGCSGTWFKVGLASQKNYISVYVCALEDGKYLAESNAERLGKVSVGKSCIRFKKLEQVNLDVLRELVTRTQHLDFGM